MWGKRGAKLAGSPHWLPLQFPFLVLRRGRHIQIVRRVQFNFNLLLVSSPGPLALQIVPRLPRKRHRQSGGAQGTPGRTSDPLAMHVVPRLPRKSGRDQGAPEGRQRDARGTPGRTSDPLPMHGVPRLPRKSRGDQMAPEGRQRDASQGVHPTPCQCTLVHACHAKAAETKGHQRDARGTPGRTCDPLPMHVGPRLRRKSGGDQGAPEGRQRDARGTPGRTSDPLPMHVVPRLPRKSGGDQGAPEGRQ